MAPAGNQQQQSLADKSTGCINISTTTGTKHFGVRTFEQRCQKIKMDAMNPETSTNKIQFVEKIPTILTAAEASLLMAAFENDLKSTLFYKKWENCQSNFFWKIYN